MTKLTYNQEKVLLYILRGKDPYTGCSGMAEYGGRTCVLKSLQRRGLIDAWRVPCDGVISLTADGESAVKEIAGI